MSPERLYAVREYLGRISADPITPAGRNKAMLLELLQDRDALADRLRIIERPDPALVLVADLMLKIAPVPFGDDAIEFTWDGDLQESEVKIISYASEHSIVETVSAPGETADELYTRHRQSILRRGGAIRPHDRADTVDPAAPANMSGDKKPEPVDPTWSTAPTWHDIGVLAEAVVALTQHADLSHDLMLELVSPLVRRATAMHDALLLDPHGDAEDPALMAAFEGGPGRTPW